MQAVIYLAVIIICLGLIVIFQKRSRYHRRGKSVDYRNEMKYGDPVKSLYTTTKVISLHHRIEITGENGEVEYRAATKILTLRDFTTLYDRTDRAVATIKSRIISLHRTHFVTMANGTQFTVAVELFHLVKDVIDIKELGWKIKGNVLQLNFEIRGADDHLIATIGQKVTSLHDKYSIDIYDTAQEELVVALLITLQHIIRDRQMAAAAAGAAGGSAVSSSSSGH